PFLCELTGDNGYKLLVGLGGDQGCLQYSPSDGRPPYLMAVGDTFAEDGTVIVFLTANTPTPIPAKDCIAIAIVKSVVRDFLKAGRQPVKAAWEEIRILRQSRLIRRTRAGDGRVLALWYDHRNRLVENTETANLQTAADFDLR